MKNKILVILGAIALFSVLIIFSYINLGETNKYSVDIYYSSNAEDNSYVIKYEDVEEKIIEYCNEGYNKIYVYNFTNDLKPLFDGMMLCKDKSTNMTNLWFY